MALNPFGEASDSIHAWKERYRQMEIQKNALTQTLAETKYQLTELTQQFNSLYKEHEIKLNELSVANQELLVFQKLSKDRSQQISELERKLDTNVLTRLQNENKILKEKIDELIGQISRGTGDDNKHQEEVSVSDASRLYNALIPVILYRFDETNSKYVDSFKNLIEVCIEDGDVLTQIISILFKYGGSGPKNRIRDLVSDKQMFSTAIEILVEEQIIVDIDDELQIYVKGDDMSDISNWNSLSMEGLLDQLIKVVEKGKIDNIDVALDNFRDILTDRGSPVATIFFEIRKLKEGLIKQKMSRKEGIEKIKIWKEKLIR